MTIDSVAVGGKAAAVALDETIARIDLPQPLAPRDSVTVSLRFVVQVPKPFNRFGRMGDAYSIAQWYPKVAVYDDLGWHADPFHYLSEFYGDYGTFDVAITVPDRFWVGATGTLARATGGDNEIPLADRDAASDSVTIHLRAAPADSLRGRWPQGMLSVETVPPRESEGKKPGPLEVTREKGASLRAPRGAPVHYSYSWIESAKKGPHDGPREEPRQEADDTGRAGPLHLVVAFKDTTVADSIRALAPRSAPGDSLLPSLKTLRFHADRVHDFAWVASPEYVRSDTLWSGIQIRALAFREDQDAWGDQRAFTVSAMGFMTREVGPYAWPSFTSAESYMGGGAMEYPMLIMNEPDLVSDWIESLDVTIAHELAHNWFYGMLGSDERAYPWLDEGLTQFMEDRYGDWKYPKGLLKRRKLLPWSHPVRDFLLDENRYLARVFARDEQPIDTPADGYQSYPQYGVGAYSKPVMMLRSLEAHMGEPAFHAFLRDYYRNNLFRHPRPADVVRSAERAGGEALESWFHPWLEGTSAAARGPGSEGPDRLPDAAGLLAPRGAAGLPPLRLSPLADFDSPEAMTFVYGPVLWHGRAEGARLGVWTAGRYLPSGDFPEGVLAAGGNLVVGTRRGDLSLGAWASRRAGVLGARGRIAFATARDAGLFRAGVSAGNLATSPGRTHPFREWRLSLDYRDRYDLAPVDPRYWSPGRGLHAKGFLALDTQGPRRAEHAALDLRAGRSAFRESGDPGPEFRYERVSAEARQQLDLLARGDAHFSWRLFAGSVFDRPPREMLFDAAEGSRVDSLGRFYLNDRGPLLRSGHYLFAGGGGLRGYRGRAAMGKRVWGLNADVHLPMVPVSLFGDVGGLDVTRPLADAGVGYAIGPLRITAPVWVGTPEPGKPAWHLRWLVSLERLPAVFR